MSESLFFICLGLLFLFSNAQKPQICTSTSVEIYATKEDPKIRLFTYSATLVTKDLGKNQSTQFLVTDEAFNSSDPSSYKLNGDGLLAAIGSGKPIRCHSIGGYCSWLVGNNTVVTSLPLTLKDSNGNGPATYNLVDEGGISLETGMLFSDSLTSSTFPGYTFVVNQCCKEFKPVPAPVADSPKCTAFNASATFYYNENIFTTVNAILTVSGDGISISASSNGSNQAYYSITQNGVFGFCNAQLGMTSNCMTLLPESDFKVIFPLSIWQPSGQTWSYSINWGRIISRNGIYEKEEGIRFTQMSPCMNRYDIFLNGTVIAVSQFCCKSFA
ncbi:hypothetical protein FO519_004767 [Halicephalobus sp. NKZ332]|nr:hypothetical protein FO519_004767 [Halicephalobus sp. NKZ332]